MLSLKHLKKKSFTPHLSCCQENYSDSEEIFEMMNQLCSEDFFLKCLIKEEEIYFYSTHADEAARDHS